MPGTDTAPDINSQPDGSYFTDIPALDASLLDARGTDQRVVSTVADALTIIENFRANTAASPWTSLGRDEVADRLRDVVSNPRVIQQGALNLCGPATFSCIWCGRDPVGFARYATELFDNGTATIGTLAVTASADLLRQDYADMRNRMNGNVSPQADWMFLGALRNSTDVFWQGSWTGDPSQNLSALTRPEEVAGWLQATGIFASVDNQANWATLAGVPQACNLTFYPGTDVALLIHLNLLVNALPGVTSSNDWLMNQFPNHFVMLLSGVLPDTTNNVVRLSIWSWGQSWGNSGTMLVIPMDQFVSNYYGSIMTRLPD